MNSLQPGFNFLFGRFNSLFDRFNSLFGRLGNLPADRLKNNELATATRSKKAAKTDISQYLPVDEGNPGPTEFRSPRVERYTCPAAVEEGCDGERAAEGARDRARSATPR
jgi:hypothetical protein